MSQVIIDGQRVQVSREQYVEFCKLAAEKKKTVGEVAEATLRPKAKARTSKAKATKATKATKE